jgi:hypothetical protein
MEEGGSPMEWLRNDGRKTFGRALVFVTTLASSLTLIIGAQTAGALPPAPTADYQFNNTLSSSVAGAPALTNLGPGTNTFVTDSVDGVSQTVLSYPKDNGVQLDPTTGVIANGFYTIATLVRIDNVGGYVRLLDFKNGTSDDGLYELNGQLVMYPVASGSASPAPIVDGSYEMVVLTRDSTGTVTAYVNGVQQFTYDDSTSQYAVIDSNNTVRFFRDNDSGGATGEDSSGAVARIEMFNSALSSTDVASLTPTAHPTVRVTPNSGTPSTSVTASGGGFSPGETVKITYKTGLAAPKPAKVVLCSATVSAAGTYSCNGTIPASTSAGALGAHKVMAKGKTSLHKAATTFTLT